MRGSEVQMVAWSFLQPTADQCSLVRPAVVQHKVDVEIDRNSRIDLLQENYELDRTMAAVTLAKDVAGGDIKCGKQAGDAMTLVVVGAPFQLSDPHGQHRLRPAQRLLVSTHVC